LSCSWTLPITQLIYCTRNCEQVSFTSVTVIWNLITQLQGLINAFVTANRYHWFGENWHL
jgi:predicted DCC family thiol-disulfide oxidoreductase YuxK